MPRIRTVKPELFRHEELFELEVEIGINMRIAWIGLLCVADREGRFKWKPKILKLDILPHDDIDFERALNAFCHHGFVNCYEVNGKRYGELPTFLEHQKPNHRELKSSIPANDASSVTIEFDSSYQRVITGQPRREHGVSTDGSELENIPRGEREGERERERERKENKKRKSSVKNQQLENQQDAWFQEFWQSYPNRVNKGAALERFKRQIKKPEDFEDLKTALKNYKAHLEREDWKRPKQADVWLGPASKKVPPWRDCLEPDYGHCDQKKESDGWDFSLVKENEEELASRMAQGEFLDER